MKKLFIALCIASAPSLMMAQGAFDAFQLSQTELRGTARFMSMGGAFGALGGDISTLNQNPAGIGVYTGSEVAATLDIDFQRTGFASQGFSFTDKQTRAACNNFGYVGSSYTGSSLMPFFAWGASYNRIQSFDRRFRGAIGSLNTSMSNYIASFSGNYGIDELIGTSKYDPFATNLPYLPILGANTGLIVPADGGGYVGLYGDGTFGDSETWTHQHGYIDEYDINFGGNFANVVYWGLGFGIQDVKLVSETYYDESLGDAYVATAGYYDAIGAGLAPTGYNGAYNIGSADWNLQNYQQVTGNGFNMKLGVIVKPINEFRIGLALHTPTWYHLTYGTNAWVGYDLRGADAEGFYGYTGNENNNDYATTLYGDWNARMRTPWRFIGSLAGVVGGRFILSADYEYNAYPSMSVTLPDDGTMAGIMNSDAQKQAVERDIKQYFQATNTLRLGAEFRINRHLSARAGYSFKSSPVKEEVRDGRSYLYTTGTQPTVEMQDVTQHVTCGLGYRYQAFYLDLAYVHQTRNSTWQAFSAFPADGQDGYGVPVNAPVPPRAIISDTRNHLVITAGFKF